MRRAEQIAVELNEATQPEAGGIQLNEAIDMARYLYSELASTVDAMHTCENNPEKYGEWASKHEEQINALVHEHLPSGSGFDSGTHLDCASSHAEKLVFTTS